MPTQRSLTFQSPKIAKLYAQVPAQQVERLRRFRAEHPCRHIVIDDADWEYIDTGRGESVLLLLPGALGTAESCWHIIEHFEGSDRGQRFRIVAVSYPPPVHTMAAMVDGVAGLAEQLRVNQATVCGGSFGGFVAQALLRRHPTLVRKLIVSHAGPPKPERGRGIARALYWMPLLPMALLRALVKLQLKRLMPKDDHEESRLMLAYLKEQICFRWSRRGLLNLARIGADFDLNYTFSREDLADWPGQVLLIMADDDPTTPEPVRNAMKALYPNACVHLFHGTGHAAPLLKRDEYLSAIETFLSR